MGSSNSRRSRFRRDDGAILPDIGWIQGYPVTVIAEEKGEDLNQRIARNFGCPQPEGYRKSLRLMKQAEKFGRPIVCLVDTQGAYCGTEAEERGQGNAIAEKNRSVWLAICAGGDNRRSRSSGHPSVVWAKAAQVVARSAMARWAIAEGGRKCRGTRSIVRWGFRKSCVISGPLRCKLPGHLSYLSHARSLPACCSVSAFQGDCCGHLY